MSPADDTFITASIDNTVRLWDLRTSPATALLSIPPSSSVYANFDQTGVIFGVGIDLDSIRLYDTRNYGKVSIHGSLIP
jgi:COMPASS component SWD2